MTLIKTMEYVDCQNFKYLYLPAGHVITGSLNVIPGSSIRYIVTDIDIYSNTPDSLDCQNSNYFYPSASYVITGNLNVISDARVRNIISKGPKYRFPSTINFPKCRREIADFLNDFSYRWCNWENVEPDALKEWKINIFKIIDTRISFYYHNTHLLPPKPNSSFRHLK